MANSSQEFRGRLLSFNDLDILVAIIIADDIYKSIPQSRKVSEILTGWKHQMEIYGPGLIDLMLDDFLRSPEDQAEFFSFLEEIRHRVTIMGDIIPASMLNDRTVMGIAFKDYPASAVLSLLNGLDGFVR